MLRLWFFGSGEIAVPTLQAVTRAHTLLGVVTQPDRPQGRGRQTTATPVKAAAQALHLLVLEPPSPRDPTLLETLRRSAPDLVVVLAYGEILPEALLAIPTLGALNVHPSWLPKYRGATPIPSAIMAGDHETGITLFRMDIQVDHGPILLQERVTIAPEETTATLTDRVSRLAPDLLLRGLAQLERGQPSWTPQEDREATTARRLSKADGWVDWSLPAEQIARRVRALTPWPGSMTSWQGRAIKLTRVAVADREARSSPGTPPGTLLRTGPDALLIQTGHGILGLHELQLAGGRPLTIAEFLRGHPMRAGELLGGTLEKR